MKVFIIFVISTFCYQRVFYYYFFTFFELITISTSNFQIFTHPINSELPVVIKHPDGNKSLGYETQPGNSGPRNGPNEPQSGNSSPRNEPNEPTFELTYPPNQTFEQIFGPIDTWFQYHGQVENPNTVREIRVEGVNPDRNIQRSTSQRIINAASGILNRIIGRRHSQ